MPTGVLHLKEVDTDEITLDGTLSVSGASTLEGATVTHNTLSVGGAATLADANATNVNVSGTLSVAGQTTMGGDIIPDTNDAYDIGSPEFKIRDLYVSNNSIWVGDDMKISNEGGKLKFRKRKTNVVPRAILDAGANAGHANEQATANAALAHAGLGDIGSMKLQHWFKFMRTLNAAAKLTDIFRDTDDDYEESSASDAWKEISGTDKIYTNSAVGVGTSDPDDTLHVKGSFKVESETGFKLIRSSVGGTDPTVIIDTQNFGIDETVNDLTGRGDAKYTKLYRVYGRNSEGVGRSWYWGYANDDYSNFSLAFDGGGLPDPDIAFTFTTASELHCNKVYAALGGNADTATKLATPRKINGIDFDGTADITIPTGVDGITSVNGKIGVGNGVASPQAFFHVSDRTVDSLNGVGNGKARFMMNVNAPGLEYHGNEYGMEIGVHGSGNSSLQSIVYDHSATTVTAAYNLLLQPFGGNVGFGTDSPSARVTVAHDMVSTDDTIPASNMGENAEFPKGTHLWLANKHGTTKPYWGLAIGTTWQGSSYIQNLNKKTSAYYNLLLQPNGGNVGIGTNNPACPFHVKFSTHAARSSGNRFEDASSTNYWENWINNGDYFYFSYNGSDRGWIQGPNGGGATKMPNFTGQHITYIKDIPFTRATECEGLIVSSDQNKYIKMNEGVETGSNAITINECLPVVSLSKVTNDKKCFGVISASEDPETRTVLYGAWGSVAEKEKGDTRVYINSVGEGAIWVVNTIGSLEAGDYITTSDVAGYGQKQDDDVLHNYTVAKITMDCDFEPMTQPVQIIKKGMVRQELVNILDEHGQIQWEDHPTETEKAYKIRYLDANGNITDDETNAVHKAAFVGCTYHCG